MPSGRRQESAHRPRAGRTKSRAAAPAAKGGLGIAGVAPSGPAQEDGPGPADEGHGRRAGGHCRPAGSRASASPQAPSDRVRRRPLRPPNEGRGAPAESRPRSLDEARAGGQGPRHRPGARRPGAKKAPGAPPNRLRRSRTAGAATANPPLRLSLPARATANAAPPVKASESPRVRARRASADGGRSQPGIDRQIQFAINETMDDVTTHQVPWHATGHHPRQRTFTQSSKLQDVLYEIRGPVHEHAARLEAEGHRILKLNIGNPAPFGFEAPDVIMRDIIQALPVRAGLFGLQGHPGGRRAVVTRYELGRRVPAVRRRRRLSRQRRLRADHDDAAGAAGQRRPGADPGAGLSAVDGVDVAGGRHPGALPVRRDPGLAARHRRSWSPRSPTAPRRSW